MNDTKRQIIVIAVLVVLIGVAGILAKNFSDKSKNGDLAIKTNTSSKSTNYFAEGRMSRDNQRSAMKQDLENIINKNDSSKDVKNDAINKKSALLDRCDKENKIETLVKGKGYDEALCFIDDKGVELTVKAKDALTAEEANQIKDIIVRTTSVSSTKIYIKQKD